MGDREFGGEGRDAQIPLDEGILGISIDYFRKASKILQEYSPGVPGSISGVFFVCWKKFIEIPEVFRLFEVSFLRLLL